MFWYIFAILLSMMFASSAERLKGKRNIEVDGGVDLVTGEVCKENGADVLVAGSAYFGSKDKANFVKQIEA